jgi:hypothetical protein
VHLPRPGLDSGGVGMRLVVALERICSGMGIGMGECGTGTLRADE